MQYNRIKLSYRSQNLYSQLKSKTGLTINILARYGICLSLKDPSIPIPEEFDEKGMEILPGVLFGEYEKLFTALLIMRLKREGLDPEMYLQKMLQAHVNRGAAALHARVNDLGDFLPMILQERK